MDRAMLDPGGGICFFAKKPTAGDRDTRTSWRGSNQLSAQLSALQASRSMTRQADADPAHHARRRPRRGRGRLRRGDPHAADPPRPAAALASSTRLELYLKLEVLQPIGSFKIRGAYNVVRQLAAEQLAGGVWTVSAGNAAQGVALAARQVGARCSVMVMDTAPDTKIRAIERLGASIVRATYDECWRTVEAHGSDRDDAATSSTRSTTTASSPATARSRSRSSRICPDVDAIVAPLGGGGLLAGIAAAVRALQPGHARLRRGAGDRGAAGGVARRRAGRCTSTAGSASFVDGAGGKSVLPTMWPLLRGARRLDRRVARRRRRAR